MSKKIENIKKRLKAYEPETDLESLKNKQRRLKVLVDEHGIECVAIAAELKVSTIRQYLSPTVQSISEPSIKKAENILEGL